MVKDYKNTVIYKIICNDTSITDSYVGHTTHFNKRRNSHKTCCNNEKSDAYNLVVYAFIRSQGGWSNWSMIEICKYPCNNKQEAELEERRFIELLNCTLNKQKPTRSHKEWREENKQKIAEYDKEYYETNTERIAKQVKEYQKNNKEKIKQYTKQKIACECGCVIVKCQLSRHKKSKKHFKLIN